MDHTNVTVSNIMAMSIGLQGVGNVSSVLFSINRSGADPGFLERGIMCIKVWGFAMLN